MHHPNFLGVGLCALLSLSISTQLFAQEDVIEKRKAIMKAKDIMGGLEKAESLFPKGSISEKSRAHPDIWEKPEEFKKSLAKARNAAEALSKAAAAKNEAEVNVKVKELGNPREGACGDCHKVFRKDFRKDS